VERVLEAFTREVRDLYGADLVAVVLFGSAATGEHAAGASDINVAVVLRIGRGSRRPCSSIRRPSSAPSMSSPSSSSTCRSGTGFCAGQIC